MACSPARVRCGGFAVGVHPGYFELFGARIVSGVIALIALMMAVVGLCAALGPARRGLKIQPQEALRADG